MTRRRESVSRMPNWLIVLGRHLGHRHGDRRAAVAVELVERVVVHLVDVVAGEDEHVLGAPAPEVDEVLVDRRRPCPGTSRSGPRRANGCSICTPPRVRSRSHGRPVPMCWLQRSGRYCVSTPTSKMPEFTQFESVKSMMRYLPPNGTAGLARRSDSRHSRRPARPRG